MQPENRVDLWFVEHPVTNHQRGTTTTARKSFLGGLEDELHRSRDFALHAREYLGSTHEHRDVIVMTAGMHDADLLAVVGRPHI